ncbi:MAG: 2-C-methyl-D-erythritol 4-phosphate cytidylyltransferase [Chloroflexi bacterium]|nr:2-C-methyl-D-erythritol 4-phosphate cytidylyltransferase [Chloroflexota bacterium]
MTSLGLVLVGAGSSRRMEGVDKVWAPLAGRPVVSHSLAELAPLASATVLVVRPEDVRRARAELEGAHPHLTIVAGGDERQDSVANGLAALPLLDAVAIHDVARPLATGDLLRAGIERLAGFHGAVPGLPVYDTVKVVDLEGRILSTVDRTMLRVVQTPQVFRFDALVEAHRCARIKRWSVSDDAGLLDLARYRVCVFPGSPTNLKITTSHDLALARFLLEARRRT